MLFIEDAHMFGKKKQPLGSGTEFNINIPEPIISPIADWMTYPRLTEKDILDPISVPMEVLHMDTTYLMSGAFAVTLVVKPLGIDSIMVFVIYPLDKEGKNVYDIADNTCLPYPDYIKYRQLEKVLPLNDLALLASDTKEVLPARYTVPDVAGTKLRMSWAWAVPNSLKLDKIISVQAYE